MKIDVTERVEKAKRITREWAERAGYKRPPIEAEQSVSKKARDLARILDVSNFGCQQRNVKAILEALIGEDIPARKSNEKLAEYAERVPFAVGSVLVPVHAFGAEGERAGLVTRLSHAGNAGMRMSNGVMHNNHFRQENLRPATDEEIDAYFSEFFGLSVNAADVPQNEGAPIEEIDEMGVPF